MKTYRKIITTILFVFGLMIAQAKDLTVTEFFEIPEDLTARTTPVLDLADNACALIKVVLPEKAAFEGNVIKSEYHTNEYYIYVSPGTQRLVIKYPGTETLTVNFTDLIIADNNKGLKGARTYRLKLDGVPEEVTHLSETSSPNLDYQNSGTFTLKVEPSDAEVLINGLRQYTDESGKLHLSLPYGSHSYRVSANKYHSTEGQFKIDKKHQKENRTVSLKPKFGYLTINSSPELDGAEVKIDGSFYGKLPITQQPIDNGTHSITILKKLYLPFTQEFNVSEGCTINLTPSFQSNYAEYQIVVNEDSKASIYIDNEFVGIGSWKGKLEAGSHTVEARKQEHKTSTKTVTVIKNNPDKIEFSSLIPEYGTLNISSKPKDIIVVIDGKKELSNTVRLKAGTHHVTLSKHNYNTEEFDVTIYPNQTLNINKELSSIKNMMVYSEPSGASIYVNDVYVGTTPINIHLDNGSQKIEAKMIGYSSDLTWVRIPSQSDRLNLKLTKIINNSKPNYHGIPKYDTHSYNKRNHRRSYEDLYIKQNEFYIQMGYNQGKNPNLDLCYGFFIKRFNFEFGGRFNGYSEEDIPSFINIKVGLALPIAYKFRLTPQSGFTLISVESEDKTIKAIPAELRCNFAFSRWFGIYLTPSYYFYLDSMKKGYGNFNASIGMYLSL